MKRKELISASSDEFDTEIKKPSKMSRIDTDATTVIKKSDKYDRQLRLWGENGQQCLENANIFLLNATATGTEILKCLVLPGVGKYTIIDNKLVNSDDISNNFFLNANSIGRSRALHSCELLQELNKDAVGTYHHDDPIELLDRDPALYSSASLVIACGMCHHDVNKLYQFLRSHDTPLVVCNTYGFFSCLSINIEEHVVVEAHPDNTLEDLRLDSPFKGLVDYMEKIDLSNMSKLEHSHTPYLVLFYKYLQVWKNETRKVWPLNYKEKCEIKEMIRKGVLKNEHGMNEVEENFDEALQNVNNAFAKTKIPSEIETIFNDPLANDPMQSKTNSVFWIIVRALKEFVKEHGVLPLRGTLPDMFSDSKRYIELQTLYKKKAEEDVTLVFNYVQESLRDLQLPCTYVSNEQVKVFCKNSSFVKVLRGASHTDVLKDTKKFKHFLDDMEESQAAVYLLIHVISSVPADLKCNKEKLTSTLKTLQTELSFEGDLPLKYLEEVLRCELHELHVVASIMGGIAAQEVIKIITKQFVPCDDTFVYNGINALTSSAKFSC